MISFVPKRWLTVNLIAACAAVLYAILTQSHPKLAAEGDLGWIAEAVIVGGLVWLPLAIGRARATSGYRNEL